MVGMKPGDSRCHSQVNAIIDRRECVRDGDGPGRTPDIVHAALPACPTHRSFCSTDNVSLVSRQRVKGAMNKDTGVKGEINKDTEKP